MNIRSFEIADEAQVVALWRECGLIVPWNDPHADIARKMLVQPELFFVGEIDGAIIATAMAGYDGHRGSLCYVAVAPEYQKRGCGRQIIEHATAALLKMGCPKINLMVRSSNTQVIAFYERLGYKTDAALCLGLRLISDE